MRGRGGLQRREVGDRGQREGRYGVGEELEDLGLGLSLTCCVISGNLLKLPEMPFPQL